MPSALLAPPGELERYTVPTLAPTHRRDFAPTRRKRDPSISAIRMATPWWRLDAQLKHRDGKRTLVGLRISRDKQARHLELVVCLETPHENTRAPSSAETERVPLSMVDIRDEQHGVLHLSAHYPSMSVQIRPHHVLGGESALLSLHALQARQGKDDDQPERGSQQRGGHPRVPGELAAGRVAQQPRDIRPRTSQAWALAASRHAPPSLEAPASCPPERRL